MTDPRTRHMTCSLQVPQKIWTYIFKQWRMPQFMSSDVFFVNSKNQKTSYREFFDQSQNLTEIPKILECQNAFELFLYHFTLLERGISHSITRPFILERVEDSSSEAKVFLFTSGTTGASKLVGFTKAQFQKASELFLDFYGETLLPFCWVCSLPIHHVGGLMIFWRSFFLKQSVCELVLVGGGPVWEELIYRACEQKISLSVSFGMTETCAQILQTKDFVRLEGDKLFVLGRNSQPSFQEEKKFYLQL